MQEKYTQTRSLKLDLLTLSAVGSKTVPLKQTGVLVPNKREKESEDEDGKDEGEITMFKSVGCAVQDISTAEYVFQRAKEMGLGTRVEM